MATLTFPAALSIAQIAARLADLFDGPKRELEFVLPPAKSREEFEACLRAIDSYNEFEWRKVAKALAPFWGRFEFSVGRDYSPVIWATPRGMDDEETKAALLELLRAAAKARADELFLYAGEAIVLNAWQHHPQTHRRAKKRGMMVYRGGFPVARTAEEMAATWPTAEGGAPLPATSLRARLWWD